MFVYGFTLPYSHLNLQNRVSKTASLVLHPHFDDAIVNRKDNQVSDLQDVEENP